MSLYNVDQIGLTREAFNRTASRALAHGVSRVIPWIDLGGGVRLNVSESGTLVETFDADYDYSTGASRSFRRALLTPQANPGSCYHRAKRCFKRAAHVPRQEGKGAEFCLNRCIFAGASFLLGQQLHDPAVAEQPERFGMWGLATQAVFFPSIIDTQGGVGGQETKMKHFVAYVHGASTAL